jgi:F-type H+-transporting ATPase subunit b
MDIVHLLTQKLLEISPDISFNPTMFVQMVLFLALFLILKPLLWEPTLASLDRRKALTSGQKEQADLEEAEILRLETEYQAKVKAARAAAGEERTKVRSAAQESAKQLIETAKNEAAKTVSLIRGEVNEATVKARGQLKSEAESAADAMTAKILGRSV